MSNITPLHPKQKAIVEVDRVTMELVPKHILDQLFGAAIAVGWTAEEGGYTCGDEQASSCLEALKAAVEKATAYTTKELREVEQPA